jgi:endoglucanase Acf2
MDSGFFLDDTALGAFLARLGMPFYTVHAFHEHAVFRRDQLDDLALLAFVFAGDHFHHVAFSHLEFHSSILPELTLLFMSGVLAASAAEFILLELVRGAGFVFGGAVVETSTGIANELDDGSH